MKFPLCVSIWVRPRSTVSASRRASHPCCTGAAMEASGSANLHAIPLKTEVGVTLIGRANDKNLCATTAYVAQIDFIAAVRDEATPLLVEAGFKVADISALLDCYALTTSLSEDDPARESARTSQRCAAFDLEEVRNALFNIKSYKDGGSIKATLYGVQCFRAQSPCKCVTKRGGVTSAQMVTTPMSTSTSSSSCSLTYNVLALALTLGAALK
jgi:hypothetical protein